mmetsp:Transcript_14947/g.28269  ORF Transcript_14947/g.28269 Transcript_14947/m.28269 type:complete len:360 (-) Transcript_14947:213-1292(-)
MKFSFSNFAAVIVDPEGQSLAIHGPTKTLRLQDCAGFEQVPMWFSAGFLLGLLSLATGESLNLRPVIGIFMQPRGSGSAKYDYIAASYVKFVESSGGRAVPVHYDAPSSQLKDLFGSINGILFPGGGASLTNTTKYATGARYMFDLAIQANDEGDHFPIWGTCLGFELIGMLAAKNDDVLCLGCYDAESLPLPLDFTAAAPRSQLFGSLSEKLYNATATLNITENSHHSGLAPEEFKEGTNLGDFYNVLATNFDRQGKQFVSAMEGKKYPIYGTQWHPEKNNFEWTTLVDIPHLPEAIELSQAMGNVFLNSARKSQHSFSSQKKLQESLIYNYDPVRDPTGYFQQIYQFRRAGNATGGY